MIFRTHLNWVKPLGDLSAWILLEEESQQTVLSFEFQMFVLIFFLPQMFEFYNR